MWHESGASACAIREVSLVLEMSHSLMAICGHPSKEETGRILKHLDLYEAYQRHVYYGICILDYLIR